MTNYVLFLDDERHPADALLASGTEVVTCRTFEEAVSAVLRRGYPSYISFDHDLGEKSKTGFDFAKWLIQQQLDISAPVEIKYGVHSQNPVGAVNIKGLIDGYNNFISNLNYND